ncbi:MAG: 6-hydroxycyclohex-1-ene-1-carbonyl-CoA dehydrogenase [Acidobacteriota bacterium]
MLISGFAMCGIGDPMTLLEREASPGPGEVLVVVAGCGVCHTDLGFYYEGVPTRHPLPLILGHEISGRVVEVGNGASEWVDREVVVPAVIPCGECDACSADRGSICSRQIFPGNDIHGGFASHVVVPAAGLCPIPNLEDGSANPGGLELAALSVIADAVSTPYQALHRAEVGPGDLVVFVGVGGVGGFGVQIAAALGARVAAIDLDGGRLELMSSYGADLVLDSSELSFKELKTALERFAVENAIPSWRRKVFDCSGSPAGQATAFGLLTHGGYLGVVGYTPRKVEIRLSNLMALDAVAQGNWGCLPEHYPAVLDLVLSGKIALEPFIEYRPLSSINESFGDLHERRITRRLILLPEF